MNDIKKKLPILFLCLIASCSEYIVEEIPDNTTDNTLWVILQMDWTHLHQSCHYTTVAFFPQEKGKKARYKIMTSARDSIALPAGRYSVIAFNNTLNNFQHIRFENTDSYNTFYARTSALKELPSYYKLHDNNISAYQPEDLYVDCIDIFNISPTMVEYDIRPFLSFSPQRKNATILVEVNIKGMNLLSPDNIVACLSNMPLGIYMNNGKSITGTHSDYFSKASSIVVNDTGDLGTITFRYTSFGTSSSIPDNYILTLFLENTKGELLNPIDVTLNVSKNHLYPNTWSTDIEVNTLQLIPYRKFSYIAIPQPFEQ